MQLKSLYTILFWALPLALFAQNVPLGFHYQAVARNPEGFELRNEEIDVRFTIMKGDMNGATQWIEEHVGIKTNEFGIFAIQIGRGEHIGGDALSFNQIPWGEAAHYLKVEINFGLGYLDMGRSQFLSVPYAFYSMKAGQTDDTNQIPDDDQDKTNEIQYLSIIGNELTISKGNSIVLPNSVVSGDNDPDNEIQYLSISGRTLSLTGSNSVSLPDSVRDDDANPTNELQQLNLQGNVLSLSKVSEGQVDLSKYLDNTDAQTLTKNGNSISISNGNSIKTDNDTTNEVQSIFLVDDQLQLSKNGGSVDLSPYLDDKDQQELSVSGNQISITGGNSIASDNDTTNELQKLSLTNHELKLSKDSQSVDLEPYLDNTDSQQLSVQDNNLAISGGNAVKIDADTLNEIQNLEFNAQTRELGISDGNSVNLSPIKVAFRAQASKNTFINYVSNDSSIFEFDKVLLNHGGGYNPLTNRFTVPNGAGGVYSFDLIMPIDENMKLRVIRFRNGMEEIVDMPFNNLEVPIGWHTYRFIIDLADGDEIAIRYVALGGGIEQVTVKQSGYFMGYRIF